MTKYLIHISLGLLGLGYAVAFSKIPGPFPYVQIMGGILFGVSAALYINNKIKIVSIIAMLGMLSYTPEILTNWRLLFDDYILDNFAPQMIAFLFLSTGILISVFIMSLRILRFKEDQMLEMKVLARYHGKYLTPTLTVAAPFGLMLISGLLYLRWV